MFARLDESLRRHAQDYMNPRDADGLPFVKNIYYLQGLAEIHAYLKIEHPFTPGEVNDLLMFADPLAVAQRCWEENEDKYCLRISDLIDKHHLRDLYPPVDFDAPAEDKKPSLREQLDAATRQARRELSQHPPDKGAHGGDAR